MRVKPSSKGILLLLLEIILIFFSLGYYLGRQTKTELHDEYIRGAVTAISYQYERNSPPSGNWLDVAFEYGYITDKYDFNEVDKAVINRVSNSNKARYDKADTTVKFK